MSHYQFINNINETKKEVIIIVYRRKELSYKILILLVV